ncbi:DEKNAAC104643 [Brettanomyces naardenensis]|uniref:DEKNAAC104643 n=1 Tax=Brettanomyces naardenensis TaxID=13370 RepID=A0A448YRB3_BRENA|nr:DEKNAAC104643 [Brettanomyces naardenensis]
MSVKSFLKYIWDVYKIPDPSTFKTEYIDSTIDRERKPVNDSKGWQKNSFLQSFNLYPAHYSAYERKFLLKFDISVFLFLGASFYTKYLDNTNIAAAYVSGMSDDLNLKGDELNLFNTYYTISYAILQIPLTLLITRPQFSRYLLLGCEFIWGMLTFANAFVQDAQQVYAIRFFIGVTEACSFPATYVIFSSFLTDDELFTRAGIYGAFATAGSASSGVLQSWAYKNLRGVGGLAGWRWQFIVDSILTVIVVIYGFFLFPGTPSSCRKFGLFTEDDMIFARKRLDKKVAIPQKFTKRFLKETFTTWQFYVCALMWTFHHSSFYTNGDKLYMKASGLYSVTQVTDWDTYTYLLGIPSTILICPLTQWFGKLPVVGVVFVTAFYAATVLVIWNLPNSVIMSAFFLQHVMIDGLSQLFYGWSATLCKDNVEKKALVLGFMQSLSYATNAWVIPLEYNMKYSPRFKAGYIANVFIIGGTLFFFLLCWVLSHYDQKLIPKWAGYRHLDNDGNMKYLDDEEENLEDISSDLDESIIQETVSIGSRGKK